MDGYRKLELKELQSIMLMTMGKIHSFCLNSNIKYYIIGGTLLGSVRHGGFIPWDDDIDIAMCREDFDSFKELFIKENPYPELFLQDYETDKDFGLSLMRICIRGTYLDWPAQRHLKNCKNAYIDIFPLDKVPSHKRQQDKQAKRIKTINELCNIKLYNAGESRLYVVHLIKSVLHFILKIVPIRTLVKIRNREMRQYNWDDSLTNVCSMQSHYSYAKQNMNYKIYGTPALYKFENIELYGPYDSDSYLKQLFGDYMQLPPENKRPKPLDTYMVI